MSVTVELDLPEGIIQQARQMGLLDNGLVAELLAEEVRRRNAGKELKKLLDEIRSVPGEPLTMDEIGAEIKAARAERRAPHPENVKFSGSVPAEVDAREAYRKHGVDKHQ